MILKESDSMMVYQIEVKNLSSGEARTVRVGASTCINAINRATSDIGAGWVVSSAKLISVNY